MGKFILSTFVSSCFLLLALLRCGYAHETKPVDPENNQTNTQVEVPTERTVPTSKVDGALSSENKHAAIVDISACTPQYPVEALRNGWEGRVVMGFFINKSGDVTDSRIVKSSGKQVLDEEARSSLSKCIFRPALSAGMPISTWTQVTWVWKLD